MTRDDVTCVPIVTEGMQQGEPLGPLFLSMALEGALSLPNCELVVAYLKDVVMGESVESLGEELAKFTAMAISTGLMQMYLNAK